MRSNDPSNIEQYQAALAARTTGSGLIVPAWVMKDREFYGRVQQKGFHTQTALDSFINAEASRRHRPDRRFAGSADRRFNPDADHSVQGSVINVRRLRHELSEAV